MLKGTRLVKPASIEYENRYSRIEEGYMGTNVGGIARCDGKSTYVLGYVY